MKCKYFYVMILMAITTSIFSRELILISDEGLSVKIDIDSTQTSIELLDCLIWENLDQLFHNSILGGTDFSYTLNSTNENTEIWVIQRNEPERPSPRIDYHSGLYFCPHCVYQSGDYGTIYSHIMRHLNHGYYCSRCFKSYCDSQTFRRHFRRYHK